MLPAARTDRLAAIRMHLAIMLFQRLLRAEGGPAGWAIVLLLGGFLRLVHVSSLQLGMRLSLILQA